MANKLDTNIQAYRTTEALEKYSSYHLFPIEKYLFLKYYSNEDTVLDLACGAGRTTLRLHELGYTVKGVDLSDPLIDAARTRFPYLSLEVGNYCHINEEDNSFSHILISHNGLDYAYPEEERINAIRECYRVLKPGGTFIFSSHNIKSLYFSPFYFLNRKRLLWKTRNTLNALSEQKYILDLGMWTFWGAPNYVINQTTREGFRLTEMIGFRLSHNHIFNNYCSPYIHYVFTKS